VFVIAGEIASGAETIREHDTLFVDVAGRDLVPSRESLVVRVAFKDLV
jgi:hypothetical protein